MGGRLGEKRSGEGAIIIYRGEVRGERRGGRGGEDRGGGGGCMPGKCCQIL